MTAKEYLNQLRHLDNRINQQLRELADLRTTATSIGSMDYSKTRVQSGGGAMPHIPTSCTTLPPWRRRSMPK